MRHVTFLLALACALITPAAGAVDLVRSDFEADAEGWRALNGVASQGWVAEGGDPGGYFSALDSGGGVIFVYDAPAAYLGDQTAALGGSLAFSLKTSTLALPMANPVTTVRIIGGGLTLAAAVGDAPGLDWTRYALDIVPTSFRIGDAGGPEATLADLQTVFGQIDSIRIRGEFSQLIDRGGLDSVVLSAVPEPSTWALMLAGVAGLAWRRRRPR